MAKRGKLADVSQNSPAREHQALRHFARTYTRHTGLLRQGLHGTAFSLSEARILYELANGAAVHALDLVRELRLDRGYVSRVLRRFEKQGLVRRKADPADHRRVCLALTAKGRQSFALLDECAESEAASLLSALPPDMRARLVGALSAAAAILAASPPPPVVIREAAIGDLGWVIHRQARLYHEEYAWDGSFEGLVAEIAGKFLGNFNPAREGCWLAARGADILGSVMLVDAGKGTAKLRLLYVEPAARGLGLGGRLVDQCIAFARAKDYRRLNLWTNDVLTAARAIYQKRGFVLMSAAPHRSFGHDLVGETWELDLKA